jgi:transposase
MDNMRVHWSKVSREAYDRLGITPIFNVPYSPQFNGIESVFSIVKGNFKKAQLCHLLAGRRYSVQRLIREAVLSTDREKVRRCL